MSEAAEPGGEMSEPVSDEKSVGTLLGGILASYRDGESKDCAEMLVAVWHRIELLQNEVETLRAEVDRLTTENHRLRAEVYE